MSMFGPKKGVWGVSSESDPRWNKSGVGYGLVTYGGPPEIYNWVDECKQKYGNEPEDLEVWFMKD